VPEAVVEATVETVDGKRTAAKSGSRQSGGAETTASDRGRTETAAADPGSPETRAAHTHPAAAEAAAKPTATAVETPTATTVETATATAEATTSRSRVRRQHGDRCGCEQGNHYCA
jgi:hypothetical protein